MYPAFKDKVDFIVKTDALLKDYLESVVVQNIKNQMPEDTFKKVTTNHIQAALMLRNMQPCSLTEFAQAMRLSKAAASALVERMVKAGTVERKTNPDNRREVILGVSPALDKHVNHVETEITNWFASLTEDLGQDFFDKWFEVMTRLNTALTKRIKSVDIPY